METIAHAAPTTPAWELLRKAAEAVMVDEPKNGDVTNFIANMIARKDELIPEEHRNEMMPLIMTAACAISDIRMDEYALEFLDAQIGRDELAKLLNETGQWIIKDCECGHAPGYHVWTANEEKIREATHRRFVETLLGGLGGMPGISVLEIVHVGGPGRRRPNDERTETDPNKKVEEPEPASQAT